MPGAVRLHPLSTDRAEETSAPDDADLVARAQHDREAFGPLYDRYADPIYRYCYRRLGSPEAAADAASLVFAKALTALPSYRGGSFRGWLFTIAQHVVIDTYGERGPDAPLASAAFLVDPAPTPEQAALLAEQRDEMRAVLARLTAEQRRIVELRLAGLTGVEIAEALGCSLSAVKSSQFRAFARLRHLISRR
ncbi:MAG: RNA polymerase sigma factor [Thermomicrobiales bacterium]